MQTIINYLTSLGRWGGAGLMALGLGHMFAVYMGWLSGTYEFGASLFFTGLGILGIRNRQDRPTPQP